MSNQLVKLNRIRPVTTGVCLLLTSVFALSAQTFAAPQLEDAEPAPAVMAMPAIAAQAAFQFRGQADPEAMAMELEENFNQTIETRIGELNRVCSLSENQLKKLRIAAKGAVAKTMELETEAREKIQEQMEGFGAPQIAWAIDEAVDDFEAEVDAEENGDDEDGDAGELAEAEFNLAVAGDNIAAQMMFPAMFGDQSVSGCSPADTDIWVSAVDKTLTDEQKQLHLDHLASRELFQRQTLVNSFVMDVDRELCLSADQRQRLTKSVDQHYGEQLLKNESANNGQNFGPVFNGLIQLGAGPAAEEPDDADVENFKSEAREILDDNQITVWEHRFEPQLTENWGNGFRPPMPMMGGAGAIQGMMIEGPNVIELNLAPQFVAPEVAEDDEPEDDGG